MRDSNKNNNDTDINDTRNKNSKCVVNQSREIVGSERICTSFTFSNDKWTFSRNTEQKQTHIHIDQTHKHEKKNGIYVLLIVNFGWSKLEKNDTDNKRNDTYTKH